MLNKQVYLWHSAICASKIFLVKVFVEYIFEDAACQAERLMIRGTFRTANVEAAEVT